MKPLRLDTLVRILTLWTLWFVCAAIPSSAQTRFLEAGPGGFMVQGSYVQVENTSASGVVAGVSFRRTVDVQAGVVRLHGSSTEKPQLHVATSFWPTALMQAEPLVQAALYAGYQSSTVSVGVGLSRRINTSPRVGFVPELAFTRSLVVGNGLTASAVSLSAGWHMRLANQSFVTIDPGLVYSNDTFAFGISAGITFSFGDVHGSSPTH